MFMRKVRLLMICETLSATATTATKKPKIYRKAMITFVSVSLLSLYLKS